MAITKSSNHIVLFPSHFWGHARTMCTLAARIVKLRNFTVTFFTGKANYDRVKAEIARDFLPAQEHLKSRIRLIGIEESKADPHDLADCELAFEAAWVKILADEPLVCAKTGAQVDALPERPSAILLDLFLINTLDTVKKLSPSVKVFSWYPASVLCVFQIFGEDPEPVIKAEAERRGMSFESVAYEMMSTTTGRLVEDPCNPPMYDYECHPQAFAFPPDFIGRILVKIAGRVRKADGLVGFDAADYAPDAVKKLRELLAERSLKMYFAGPLIPQVQEDTSRDPRSAKILKFLDEKLVSHGQHSVIYISFGSVFWPADPAKLWAVLEVIMEKNIPFVMSCSPTFASASPTEFQEKVAQYGNAIIEPWVPQQALLDHAATGWYISHGGHNSTLETIVAGVPTIMWPIDADQPMNAIYLSEKLEVGYELIEVRNGTGAGKIYRTGRTPIATVAAVKDEMRDVLERAFGADGARKRANLEVVTEKLRAAWKEGGVAQREMEEFLDGL